MAKYRDHRGTLDDSMQTVREVADFAALFEYLRSDLASFGFTLTPGMVDIAPYGVDSRIGWDTYIVRIDGYGVAGFTDGPLDPPTS